MDRQAADVLADGLDLATVDTDPDGQAELPGGSHHRRGTSHRSRRTIEDREEAIAGRLDLASIERVQVVTEPGVVPSQLVPPALVPHALDGGGRVHDVRE